MIEQLLPAFLLGLLGAGHCVAMCGGIATALGLNAPGHLGYSLLYQLGRVSSYMLIGLIFALFASFIPQSSILYLRLLAALLLLGMALYLSGIWNALAGLERVGKVLWSFIQPLAIRIKRPNSMAMAFAAGVTWGWLPCGMIYSALGLASLSANPFYGALTMLAFGLGTFPAMTGLTIFSQSMIQLISHRLTRIFSAILVFSLAIWTAYSAIEVVAS
ncbi:sulfite exporter TauE/SafE family protein [Gynuella sp.]|uniref:sulfite exporter TauE/SafE family protein n=1 Tax=Gynuella sp. TaxID=2969146 RepID=UPI003D0E98C6